MTFFPNSHPLEWKCHVCGDMRPDAQIGVIKYVSQKEKSFGVTYNVRYCRDRSVCLVGSADVAIRWAGEPVKGYE